MTQEEQTVAEQLDRHWAAERKPGGAPCAVPPAYGATSAGGSARQAGKEDTYAREALAAPGA